MAHLQRLIKWWARWREDWRWRRLRKQYPVLNEIVAAAWRAGWNCERWDVELADRFFAWVPDEIIERGGMILDRLRAAYYDGAIEKSMELQDDRRAEYVRFSRSPSLN